MKLAGRQLLLDTNVLVHLIRGGTPGSTLEDTYAIRDRRPRAIVPIVVKGEIKSLAQQLSWGADKVAALNAVLNQLPAADISAEVVLEAYATIDSTSRKAGHKLGKNDAWIAAIAKAQGAVVVTTDKDFLHLHPQVIEVEYVDPVALAEGRI